MTKSRLRANTYTAGVEAAPHLKHRELRQNIFRDGIPDDSIVLRDWDDDQESR
jgi:hypothetical protein